MRSKYPGKVLPQLVDKSGKVQGDSQETFDALSESMGLKKKDVKDVAKFLDIFGATSSGKDGVKFTEEKGGKVKIAFQGQQVVAPRGVVDVKGAVLTDVDAQLEELLNNLTATFSLTMVQSKTAEDILGVYGL